MICPNADGTESPTYHEHNDSRDITMRRLVLVCKEERARMLATIAERDLGCITLYMSRYELKARLMEARAMELLGEPLDKRGLKLCRYVAGLR